MRLSRKLVQRFSGQSLIEVVVAVGVVAALAVALVSTSLFTQRTSRSAKNNTQATKLVQQNIEQVRVLRDRKGFDSLFDGSCLTLNVSNPDPIVWSLNVCSGGADSGETIVLDNTEFMRKIAVSSPSGSVNKKEVTVTVSWRDSGGLQSVVNTTFLSNCINSQDPC